MKERVKSYWYRLSIRGKQLAVFSVIIFCISLFSIYSLSSNYLFGQRFHRNTNKFFNISKLKNELTVNRELITAYLDSGKLEDLNQYNESVNEFEKILTKVEEESTSLDAYFLLRAVKNSYISAYDEYNMAIRKRRVPDLSYRIHEYKGRRIYQYMLDYIDDLSEVNLLEGNTIYQKLMRDSRLMQIVMLVGIILITIACFGFSVMLSNYLSRPIMKLASLSEQMAEGNLDVQPIAIQSLDEVGSLAGSFNAMSASIKEMINDLKNKSLIEKMLHEEEIKNITMRQLLKEARFLGLQSQINPHFLFNTLNTISRIVMFGKSSEAIRLIESLSNLLRYNLGDYNKQVTLKHELEITNHYLYIQRLRFGERLTVSIVCKDENLLKENIPCFTLQPLVENAMIHGIEPKEEGGSIRIKISSEKSNVLIKIIDDGVGIPKERIQEIMDLKENKSVGHTNAIGISNVLNRLTIFTGVADCFAIKSKIGLGTVVSIKIHKKEAEQIA